MKSKARVIPSGNATGVEIPEHVVNVTDLTAQSTC
jgi:hypothetical protein